MDRFECKQSSIHIYFLGPRKCPIGNVEHDKIAAYVCETKNSYIHGCFSEHCRKLPKIVFKKIDSENKSETLQDIINEPLFSFDDIPETSSQKYLPSFWDHRYVNESICVKSPMGTGKNYQTQKIINKFKYVLLLSTWKTYTDSLKEKYGFMSYLDADVIFSDESPKWIVQIDSIAKIRNPQLIELIIFDEIESIWDQLLCCKK